MFSNTKGLAIPQGNVTKIESNGIVLWQLKKEETFTDIYQQVEWIEAGANVGAYLDLGFAFDTKAKIELSQYISGNATTYVFGAAENSGKLRCMLTSPSANKYIAYAYGSSGSAYIENQGVTLNNNNVWNEFEITLEAGNLYMIDKTNGNTGSRTTQGTYTMSSNLYLFAQNYNGTARFGGMRRIGYFKYYGKNNELICDLIPCYRKSDGVIGMYDIVREIFLTNVGSGTFTKGADITS